MLLAGEGELARLNADGKLSGGFYFPPTVVSGAHAGMAIMDEETFGPLVGEIRIIIITILINRRRLGR